MFTCSAKIAYTCRVAQLFVVATPIGNLEDITLRAVRILGEVDCVAAENPQHSLRLLNHLGIRKSLIACHAHNGAQAAAKILEQLESGKTVAYISDAGTPGISDPGAFLVRAVRQAGYPVSPVPGPSALTALASVSGQGGKQLIFDGFLSPKPGRRKKQLKALLDTGENCIVYESPFRILKLLADILEADPDRQLVVGRELTKIHEEILAGTCAEILENLSARASIKGEFAVFIAGIGDKTDVLDEE